MKSVVEFVSKRTSLVGWVAALGVLAVVVYFLVTALLTPDAPPSFGQPQITMNKVEAQGQRAGQLGWKFAAESSDTSTDGMVTTYHHVREGVYYIKGKPAYKLTADDVTLDMRTQNYTGSGNVHIWSVRPREISDLRTDNVMWNNPLQMLTCPSDVHIKYKGYDMVSSHLQVNLANGSSTLGTTTISGTR